MAAVKKPLGITAIALYSALSGLLFLPVGFLLLLPVTRMAEGSYFYAGIGVVFCCLGVFFLASVYGLWSIQEWGRRLTIKLNYISAIVGFIAIFPVAPKQQFTVANLVVQIIGIGICMFIISYLSKHHVKTIFIAEQP